MESILIIQTAFIGDVILSLPLAQFLKKDHKVHYLITPQAQDIVKGVADKTIIYDKRGSDKGPRGFYRLLQNLRLIHYQAIFIPHRSLRSALLAFFHQSKVRIGFSEGLGRFFHTQRVPYTPGLHEIEKVLKLLEKYTNHPVPLSNPHLGRFKKKGYIVLAPGSKWNTKRWPIQKWISLIEKLLKISQKIIITGSPDEASFCNKILTSFSNSSIENRTGQDSLQKTFEIIGQADLLICNDSAPAHIALGVDTPAVVIFGPTVKEFGYYPLDPRSIIVDVPLDCRPCGSHGHQKCPINTHACMENISPQRVFDEIKKRL